MEKKIKDALEVFRKTYFKSGNFDSNYTTFDGNVVEYNTALDGNGRSRIIGNSIFSPRIKKVTHFSIPLLRSNKDVEDKFILTIHNKLPIGIAGRLRFKDMKEITIDVTNMSADEIMNLANEFLHMNNAEVMEKYGIKRNWFSKETLEKMDAQDRKIMRYRRFEEKVMKSIEEGKRLARELEEQKANGNKVEVVHER